MSDPPVLSIGPEQARALAAPARREIVTYLARAGSTVSVNELSHHLGLNHTGVRKHLARLVSAGLVDGSVESRTSPGRPRLLYRLTPGGPASRDAPYERLAVLLATAMASGQDPLEVGRHSGRSTRVTTDSTLGSPLDGLVGRLAMDGFDPAVRRRGPHAEIVLRHCPLESAVRANPKAVCRLHLGLLEGAAEAIGGLRVDGLAQRDPRRAGCRLDLAELSCTDDPGSDTATT